MNDKEHRKYTNKTANMKSYLFVITITCTSAFVVEVFPNACTTKSASSSITTTCSASRSATTLRPNSSLFSTPPKRVARRDMKKRPRRKREGSSKFYQQPKIPDVDAKIETRPLVRSRSVEAGEDYWIEEDELQKYTDREKSIKNRKAMEGEISQDKLREEVVAPYKQNWIGLISVGIIVLAVIVKEFPELLNAPMIPIPDL